MVPVFPVVILSSYGGQPFVLWPGERCRRVLAGKKENSKYSCLRKNLIQKGPIGIFLFSGK